jgi:CelD/BcsL family acetyltransferase involved in cellulose biosynthesis
MHPIRIAPTSSQADEWALVLMAAGIPNMVEPDADGWAVLAPTEDIARANAALTAYDEEDRGEAQRTPGHSSRTRGFPALLLACYCSGSSA